MSTKTNANLRAIAARINEIAASAIRKSLIPPQTVATVIGNDDGTETLYVQIERWRENGRTLSREGMAEIAAEDAAEENLLAVAGRFGKVA